MVVRIDAGTPAARKALREPDPAAAEVAIATLSSVGTPEARAVLGRVLAGGDPSVAGGL